MLHLPDVEAGHQLPRYVLYLLRCEQRLVVMIQRLLVLPWDEGDEGGGGQPPPPPLPPLMPPALAPTMHHSLVTFTPRLMDGTRHTTPDTCARRRPGLARESAH